MCVSISEWINYGLADGWVYEWAGGWIVKCGWLYG